jgi:hypothetical protein
MSVTIVLSFRRPRQPVGHDVPADLLDLIGFHLATSRLEVENLRNPVPSEDMMAGSYPLDEAQTEEESPEFLEADVGVGIPLGTRLRVSPNWLTAQLRSRECHLDSEVKSRVSRNYVGSTSRTGGSIWPPRRRPAKRMLR